MDAARRDGPRAPLSRAGPDHPETRLVYFALRSPDSVAHRRVTLSSNLGRLRVSASPGGDLGVYLPVCVPARGFTEIAVSAEGSSAIPGDIGSEGSISLPRLGGVVLDQIELQRKVGGRCLTGPLRQRAPG